VSIVVTKMNVSFQKFIFLMADLQRINQTMLFERKIIRRTFRSNRELKTEDLKQIDEITKTIAIM
jgi:hypothetical protein